MSMTLLNKPDVLIVGAGLAGLSAAVTLINAGLTVQVIEGSHSVGGRVKTTHRDGYTLDHGFQVFNPAYKNAKQILDYSKLNLRSFAPGVKIVDSNSSHVLGNPLLNPAFGFEMIKQPAQFLDLAKFGLYCAKLLQSSQPDNVDIDARTALRQAHLSDLFIDKTLNPFLSGVFLESELKTSRRFLDFVLEYFLRGTPAVPLNGMNELATQLANQLPTDSLLLNTWVHGIKGHNVQTDAGELTAKFIVLATDSETTGAWLGTSTRGWRSVTTWYHSTDIAREHIASGMPLLHVDADKRGPLVNTVPISHAAASYAPSGKHLISSSTLDINSTSNREYEVRAHLAHIYKVDTSNFELVDVFEISKALPISNVPLDVLTDVEVRPNLFVAGDAFTSPSINGAIESGQKAANSIIAKTR